MPALKTQSCYSHGLTTCSLGSTPWTRGCGGSHPGEARPPEGVGGEKKDKRAQGGGAAWDMG